ncbi:GNAT family N-acetyltransferase [Paenibacillus massiliensis]|uniref:GNAT family N-acetyltransferase n=1 Tax=Paenibacillus massiliensis TaxID=225917 RepID=UPI00040AB220|nr:N-acetyltransferase [Paenibacillus massiliensis]
MKLVTIDPMQASYNQQVSHLLVHSFGSKFRFLTGLGHHELACQLQQVLESFPEQHTSQRVVAVQEGKVIGTLSLKWHTQSQANPAPDQGTIWRLVKNLNPRRAWAMFRFLTGLQILSHTPKHRECYIADVAVHPDFRGKGVGTLLIQWAQEYAYTHPLLHYVSLHVAASNSGAQHLYEQHSFRTLEMKHSLLSQLLFGERMWHYMISQPMQSQSNKGELRAKSSAVTFDLVKGLELN